MSEPERPRPIRDAVHFLGRFARNPGSVGAVTPSSRYLAAALAGDLNLENGDIVLEYGPGTGPMTHVIDNQFSNGPDAHYLGIELNLSFCDVLRRRYPHLDFEHGSVAEVPEILEKRGLTGPVKKIISGLPFASLPKEIQVAVIAGIREVLHPDGEFRTFQYVHAWHLKAARRFRGMMDEQFGSFERSRAIVRNLPPAYVLKYRH